MSLDFAHVPEEIPLAAAPLVRVLCQIRYSSVPELVDSDVERVFASLFEEEYPVRGAMQGMVLPLAGLAMSSTPELFRTFEDAEGKWKATLAPEFVSLETNSYGRRDDFLARLQKVLEVLSDIRRPPKVTRIGLRYTDRIVDPQGMQQLVHPALLGLLPELSGETKLKNQVLQTLLEDEGESQVQVRSLFLPPDVSFDLSIPPVPFQSWVLDIDAFNEIQRPFETLQIVDTVRTLAERAYGVFHWAVKDKFREEYGAKRMEVEK